MATLINGNGNAAVYAQQDADLYAGFKGNSTQILNVGSKLAATIEDSNTIAVADGVILTKEGRRIQVDVGNIDEFIIPTGQAGTTRYYIFGYHLYTDGSANQKCETFVQLMSDGSETITENTFRGGATEVYVSLYRVKQEGLTLGTPAALLSVCETIDEIKSDIDGITASLTEQEERLDDMVQDDYSLVFVSTYVNVAYSTVVRLEKYLIGQAYFNVKTAVPANTALCYIKKNNEFLPANTLANTTSQVINGTSSGKLITINRNGGMPTDVQVPVDRYNLVFIVQLAP